MTTTRRQVLGGGAAALLAPAAARAVPATIRITTPMAPPRWALLQRELFDRNLAACEAFFAKYVDERGWLKVTVRWGADDGPDDAAEATNDWGILYALGGSERLRAMYRKSWEGHLQQYTAARTVDVSFARDGMYYREFPTMMDWQHNSEGLTTFNVMGLGDPHGAKLIERTRRFADFYTGVDPTTGNYDTRHRIVRSLLNGSRGPMLREATEVDWTGDPFDPRGFHLDHGEQSYAEMLTHFADYKHVVGDSPLNLQSTTLGLNAYALGCGDRFRGWALDYLGAWAERAQANDGILPSNVGLDGMIGGSANGHWWGGVYGWGFSPVVPQTGKREDRNRVPRSITAFMGGVLLSGDRSFIDLWRRQTQRINEAGRNIDGVFQAPTMHGADGWYSFRKGPYRTNGWEIWYVSQRADDRAAAGEHPWVSFLEGKNPDYPVTAMEADLARIAKQVKAREEDPTTPATRLADWPLDINPASVTALVQLQTGGLHIARPPWSPTSPPQGGVPFHCRLRYFDPVARRAGLPPDTAALVTALGDASTEVTLVNIGAAPREIVVQGGGYGEHRIDALTLAGRRTAVGGRHVTLRLEPGCGASLHLAMTRYANRPTLAFPWDGISRPA